MGSRAVVGIDVGSSATKVVLCRLDGSILATGSLRAEVRSPQPGFAEVDPDQWWQNVCLLLPKLLAEAGVSPRDVEGIGVSGSVPTLIAVDPNFDPLYPSIQQNDARATVEIEELGAEIPDAFAATGSAITAQSVGPKWRWLGRHRPDVVARATGILGSYGFIVAKLTDVAVSDENWALESGFARLGGGWDASLFAPSGVRADLLPTIMSSLDLAGGVSADAAAATGLREGTPVTAGCADHVVSAYAAGLLAPGDTLLKIGGAGDVLTVSETLITDERLFIDHHPTGGRWMPNGCMASSGSVLQWFSKELAGGAALPELDTAATAVGAGSGGVLALPYFLGEKTPIHDPLARGAFVGLHLGHTRAHLYRAALEGVAFGFAHHLDVMAEIGLDCSRIFVTNGGSRSRLWKQTIADTLGRPVSSLASHPGSSWGAALLAIGAIGVDDPDTLVEKNAVIDEEYVPDDRAHDVLVRQYRRFRDLQVALDAISHSISNEGFL